MRMQAIWNDTVIADNDQTMVVEGNHYFPEDSLRREVLQAEPIDDDVPVEGHGLLLLRHCGREDQPGRGLAVPTSPPAGPKGSRTGLRSGTASGLLHRRPPRGAPVTSSTSPTSSSWEWVLAARLSQVRSTRRSWTCSESKPSDISGYASFVTSPPQSLRWTEYSALGGRLGITEIAVDAPAPGGAY